LLILFRVANNLFPVANNLLPVAKNLIPVACILLPVAYILLPVVNNLFPGVQARNYKTIQQILYRMNRLCVNATLGQLFFSLKLTKLKKAWQFFLGFLIRKHRLFSLNS
jgi:hypothetical protein